MDRWIKETSKRSYKVHYLGPRSQNEFIELLANETRKIIVNEVKEAIIYSMSADTTPDITHEDRLAVCTRYVNNQENNTLNPGLITFQSYDFASNMSGKFNGAHVKLSELTGHRIPFIPCQAHRLNTFLEHSCNASTIIANMVDTLENLYVFFSASSKRFMKNIMYKLKCLTETLETKHLCIIDAIALIDSTMKMMTEIKSDDQAINNLIDSALSFATLLGTNPESYLKTHHRRRLCPKRIDPRPSTEVEFTIHLFYRREFKLVLDTLITLSNSNLKQCISSVQSLFQLFSQPLDKSNITLENITNSLSLFPVDSTGSNLKDLDLVQTQLEILFNMLQDDSKNFESLMAKSGEVKHILPSANLLCRLALTSPVTVASNERTFSKLKLVKTFLRSTMNDDRLNSLVILGIEKDTVDQLNIDKLAQQW
ncbi:hypothetical protein QTP88_009145 [Uroleucon formosanum]